MTGRPALLLLLALGACASAPEPERPTVAAIDEWVAQTAPAETDSIQVGDDPDYKWLNERYARIAARGDEYLLRFARRCLEGRRGLGVPTRHPRSSAMRTLRTRFDSIHGCRIDNIYVLPPAEAEPNAPAEGQTSDSPPWR